MHKKYEPQILHCQSVSIFPSIPTIEKKSCSFDAKFAIEFRENMRVEYYTQCKEEGRLLFYAVLFKIPLPFNFTIISANDMSLSYPKLKIQKSIFKNNNSF